MSAVGGDHGVGDRAPASEHHGLGPASGNPPRAAPWWRPAGLRGRLGGPHPPGPGGGGQAGARPASARIASASRCGSTDTCHGQVHGRERGQDPDVAPGVPATQARFDPGELAGQGQRPGSVTRRQGACPLGQAVAQPRRHAVAHGLTSRSHIRNAAQAFRNALADAAVPFSSMTPASGSTPAVSSSGAAAA